MQPETLFGIFGSIVISNSPKQIKNNRFNDPSGLPCTGHVERGGVCPLHSLQQFQCPFLRHMWFHAGETFLFANAFLFALEFVNFFL